MKYFFLSLFFILQSAVAREFNSEELAEAKVFFKKSQEPIATVCYLYGCDAKILEFVEQSDDIFLNDKDAQEKASEIFESLKNCKEFEKFAENPNSNDIYEYADSTFNMNQYSLNTNYYLYVLIEIEKQKLNSN